jgi:hypothetical protein
VISKNCLMLGRPEICWMFVDSDIWNLLLFSFTVLWERKISFPLHFRHGSLIISISRLFLLLIKNQETHEGLLFEYLILGILLFSFWLSSWDLGGRKLQLLGYRFYPTKPWKFVGVGYFNYLFHSLLSNAYHK